MWIDSSAIAPNSPVIPTSVGVAILSAYLLDWLKRLKQVPKISYYSTKLNSLIRLGLSGLGTLGVSWAWSSVNGGGHQLLIVIPPGAVILSYLWHCAIAYGTQHMAEIQLAQRPVAQSAIAAQAVAGAGGGAKTLVVPRDQPTEAATAAAQAKTEAPK